MSQPLTSAEVRAQVNFDEAVTDAATSVANFVPKFVAFLVILLIGWIVAKVLRTLVTKGLQGVGFDRAVERGGMAEALSNSRYTASQLIAALVYYGILLIALQIAVGVFGPNAVSDLIADVVAWLPRLAVAVIIVVIAAAIARVVRDLLEGALGGLSYGATVAKATGWFILGLGAVAALNQVGIATAVTTPILITVLATVGGVIVVGAGGGLIRPMQQRWESWLGRAEQEAPQVSREMSANREAAASSSHGESHRHGEPSAMRVD